MEFEFYIEGTVLVYSILGFMVGMALIMICKSFVRRRKKGGAK